MKRNKPGLLTSAFLSALLLGCSHTPPQESLDDPELYKIDDYGSLRVITNNLGIWNDAKSRLKQNENEPKSPQQEMGAAEQEITTIALQRGFHLCSKEDIHGRSFPNLKEEGELAAEVLPNKKFAGFYIYQSKPQEAAVSLLLGEKCFSVRLKSY